MNARYGLSLPRGRERRRRPAAHGLRRRPARQPDGSRALGHARPLPALVDPDGRIVTALRRAESRYGADVTGVELVSVEEMLKASRVYAAAIPLVLAVDG